jgi:hypothetical protein
MLESCVFAMVSVITVLELDFKSPLVCTQFNDLRHEDTEMFYLEAWEKIASTKSGRHDRSIPVSVKSMRSGIYSNKSKYKTINYRMVVLATLHYFARMKSIQEWNSLMKGFARMGERGWLLHQQKHQNNSRSLFVHLRPKDKSVECIGSTSVDFRPLYVRGVFVCVCVCVCVCECVCECVYLCLVRDLHATGTLPEYMVFVCVCVSAIICSTCQ